MPAALARLNEHCGADRDNEGHRDCRETEEDESPRRAQARRLLPVSVMLVVGVNNGVSLPTRNQVAVQRIGECEGNDERNDEGAPERGSERPASIAPGTASMIPLSTSPP